MDITNILNSITNPAKGQSITEEERSLMLTALLSGRKEPGAPVERKVTEGVKIACKRFEVEAADGSTAFQEFFYLTSKVELTPGTKHYVATRRHLDSLERVKAGKVKSAWPPSYVMVTGFLGKNTVVKEGAENETVYVYTYDRLKSDGTRRVE